MWRAEREAMVKVVLAPFGSLSGHPHHRSKGGREEPAGCDQDEEQNEASEDERGEQCQLSRLFVGGERGAGDDRAESLATAGDRRCVEAGVGSGHIEEACASDCQCLCRLIDALRGTRLFKYSRSREYPEVGIGS